jgi:hypothetical protein
MARVWVPRPDQQAALDFVLPKARAAVWSPTGGGKTAIAGAWMTHHSIDTFEVGRWLVVAPKLVARDGWPEQIGQWAHMQPLSDFRVLTFEDLDLTRVKGGGMVFRDKRATKRRLLGLRERVHIASWDAFPWVAQALGRNPPYQGVVYDESSFLRDQGSERSRAARSLNRFVTHQLQLTATANSNHDEAVWSQMDILQPGLLGDTLTEFRDQFCVPDSKNWSTGQVYSYRLAGSQRQEFERRCAKVAVSVPRSLQVPLIESPRWVTLPPANRSAYDAMQEHQVWAGVAAGSAGVQHSKLRQMASGFVYTQEPSEGDGGDEGSGSDTRSAISLGEEKVEVLTELLGSLGDQRVLIAYEFDEERTRLQRVIGKKGKDIRQRGAKEDFIAGKLQYLTLHPKSAGHGVDGLQHVASNIVWMSVPEDRELYDQTNGRLHRHGTGADTVFCHLLVASDTVEERIWREVLPGKLSVQELLLQATQAVASSDRTAQLS